MQTQKMSLANIKGKLSRAEMKNIMAGSGDSGSCTSNADCTSGQDILCNGTYITPGPGRCYDSGNGLRCHYSVAC